MQLTLSVTGCTGRVRRGQIWLPLRWSGSVTSVRAEGQISRADGSPASRLFAGPIRSNCGDSFVRPRQNAHVMDTTMRYITRVWCHATQALSARAASSKRLVTPRRPKRTVPQPLQPDHMLFLTKRPRPRAIFGRLRCERAFRARDPIRRPENASLDPRGVRFPVRLIPAYCDGHVRPTPPNVFQLGCSGTEASVVREERGGWA